MAGGALLAILVAIHVLRVDERGAGRGAAPPRRAAASRGAATRSTAARRAAHGDRGRGLIAARLHRPRGHPVRPASCTTPSATSGSRSRWRSRRSWPDPVRGHPADGRLEGEPVGGGPDASLEPLTGRRGTFSLAIVFATVGSVVGALVGYAIGAWGGRPLLDRYGRYVGIGADDLDRADDGSSAGARWAVFLGPHGAAGAHLRQLSRPASPACRWALRAVQRARARSRGMWR